MNKNSQKSNNSVGTISPKSQLNNHQIQTIGHLTHSHMCKAHQKIEQTTDMIENIRIQKIIDKAKTQIRVHLEIIMKDIFKIIKETETKILTDIETDTKVKIMKQMNKKETIKMIDINESNKNNIVENYRIVLE